MFEEIDELQLASPPLPPLFDYTVTPQQVYTSTGTDDPVTLTVGIYNRKQNGFVTCQYIMFGISIGTSENDLTNDWQDVKGQSNQGTWGIQPLDYAGSPLIFKVEPATGTTGLGPNESISFELTGINVNDVVGPAPVRIVEVTGGQTGQTERDINKVAPPLQIVYFQAKPANVAPGEQVTLSWATEGATLCTIEPLADSMCTGSPPDSLPLTGTLEICPRDTTSTYTLTAYDAGGGQIPQQVDVQVSNNGIVSFTANPDTIDYSTAPSRLSWEVVNTTILKLDPGGLDVTGQDHYDVTPETNTTYTLTSLGAGPPVTSTAPIYVIPASVTSFTATPTEFVRGQPVTLAWVTAHANTCAIDQGVGAVTPAAGGSTQVSPQDATIYTLTAQGLGTAATAPLSPLTPQPHGWNRATTIPPASAFYSDSIMLNYQSKLWAIDQAGGTVSWTSDGINWTQVTSTVPFGGRFGCAATVFDDGQGEKMWIMGGMVSPDDSHHTLFNDVYSSTDGVTWTEAQTGYIWTPRADHACIVLQGQMLVIGGFTVWNQSLNNDVWSSTDGVNWTLVTQSAAWSPRFNFAVTVFNPSSNIKQLWLCGGSDINNNRLNEAWYTSDGATWTQAATPPWSARDRCNLQMLNNQLWLLGGVSATDLLTDMWVMDSTMTWNQCPDQMPYTESQAANVAINKKRRRMIPPNQTPDSVFELLGWDFTTGVFNWHIWLAVYDDSGTIIYSYNP